MKKEPSTILGITSFVLGLLSILVNIFIVPLFVIIIFLSPILSILAIFFAVKQRIIIKTGLSTAGLIMGIVITALYGLLFFFSFLFY